nr:MAG: putative maturation protein [Leviviridae sp.]
MVTRTRTRPTQTLSGSFQVGTGSVSNRTQTSYSASCQDTITAQPYTDHPFDVIERVYPVCVLNGTTGTPGNGNYRNIVHLPCITGAPNFNLLPAVPGNSTIATTAMARTNPSRSHVSLPVFLAELRDLPRLIRDTGRLIQQGKKIVLVGPNVVGKRDVARNYLSWQFGWKPLLSDINKMLQFSDSVAKRSVELRALYSKGGLSRRYVYRTDNVGSTTNGLIESAALLLNGRTSITSKRVFWATLKWRPTLSGLPTRDEDLQALARKLVFGVHSSQQLSNLWEALPWSWLIDWFSDIGDYLQATNNSVAHTSGFVNVMRHSRTDVRVVPIGVPSWLNATTANGYTDQKERFQVTPSPISATLPFLSGRQLSILGAISVLKYGR